MTEMRDVAPGQIGEIVHRSPHLMLGYFHDDERTKSAFEGDWFHSGDLATVDADGYIYVVDRKKDMVKTGGENVASRDVEEADLQIAASFGGGGGRRAASALGRGGGGGGRGQGRTVAVKGRRFLPIAREHLAHFKVPKDIVFAEALPKNPSGKLLKREFRRDHAALFA